MSNGSFINFHPHVMHLLVFVLDDSDTDRVSGGGSSADAAP